MMKIAVLMAALAIALPFTYPANAVQMVDPNASPACQSPKAISALTMARIYSVDPQLVGVSVQGAHKEMTAIYITTDTTTQIADAECTMKVKTDEYECRAWIAELDCLPILTPLQRRLLSQKNADELSASSETKTKKSEIFQGTIEETELYKANYLRRLTKERE